MEETETDPLSHYIQSLGPQHTNLSFTFTQINMSDLRKVLNCMKATGSTGDDDISTKMLKSAQQQLEPILLHLTNRTIQTTSFPTPLKTAKVVPIQKVGKDPTTSDGWRPINVVAAISKVIERILLGQILVHLRDHDLVGHAHHGAVRNKSTQSLVTELHDSLLDDLRHGTDTAVIALDQSKAYKIVDHKILLRKLQALGFKPQASKLMSSYLQDRKQYVVLEGKKSSNLVLGPRSVIQGSTMSTALFLIYILDLPDLFHKECQTKHDPTLMRQCKQTNAKTFVDDIFLRARPAIGQTMPQAIHKTMETVHEYMRANKLQLNPQKSQIMLITNDDDLKKNFKITLNEKVIKHKAEMVILGNTLSDTLAWDSHVRKTVIPSLTNRVRTLRHVAKYLRPGFCAQYANAIFCSKLMFGIESWGVRPNHS